MQTQLKNIDDSGCLYGTFSLNYPDSLFLVSSNPTAVSSILNNLWNPEKWKQLTDFIESADQHALDKQWYHYSNLMHVQNIIDSKILDSANTIDYDSIAHYLLLAIDGTTGLIHDLTVGRLNSKSLGINNYLPQRNCNFEWSVLESTTLQATLKSFLPDFLPYSQLFQEYNRLKKIPINIKNIKTITLLKVETNPKNADSGDIVQMQQLINQRIHVKWLSFTKKTIDNARKQVIETMVLFQNEFNLKATAVFDIATINELNRDVQDMIHKLAASMERWRQLGPMNESSKVVVNIAANELFAFKNDTQILNFLVCSGKPRDDEYYRKLALSTKPGSKIHKPDNLETPLMKAYITHFVVNPTWSVPHNIATKEMLPDIIRNPSSLSKNHFVVRNRQGELVNPYSVNWRRYSTKNFPFRIEQKFGDFNALGRIVVHFSNPYSIFLHDTPSKYAFSQANRHVSHGCVRMQLPFDMMAYLCSFNQNNPLDKARIQAGLEPLDSLVLLEYKKDLLDSTLRTKHEPKPKQYFKLDKKIAIYLCYFTAFSTPSGFIQYADDSYHSDEIILAEMKSNYKRRNMKH